LFFSRLDFTRPTAAPRARGFRLAAIIALPLYLALLIYLSLIPVVPGSAEISDKVLHFVAYGGLTALAAAAWPKTRLLILFLILSAAGALLEFAQGALNLGRMASFQDQIANMGGIAMALAIWIFLVWIKTTVLKKS